jgi:hypothetical protein
MTRAETIATFDERLASAARARGLNTPCATETSSRAR